MTEDRPIKKTLVLDHLGRKQYWRVDEPPPPIKHPTTMLEQNRRSMEKRKRVRK